jgi:hypothetical protein
VSQLLLLRGKPVRCKWSIWEKKEPDYSYKSSHCTLTAINVSSPQLFHGFIVLHNKKPSPTSYSLEPIHPSEDTSGDEARKSRGEDLRTVQERYTRSNLWQCFS